MKIKVNGFDVECTAAELRELLNAGVDGKKEIRGHNYGKSPVYWKKSQDKKLKEYKKQGMSTRDMSKKLGKSISAINSRIVNLGIGHKKRKKKKR